MSTQTELVEAMSRALTAMAEDNSRLLAGQIVATVESLRNQEHSLAALFYPRVHIPDELLAVSSFPSGVRAAVILREQVCRSMWTEEDGAELVELPNGELVVFLHE